MIEVKFTGKVGKLAELKGEGDKQYITLRVAVEKYVGEGKGDERDGKPTAYKTTWVNVTAFKRTAQFIADRFSVGDSIVVSGELELKTYEKKEKDSNNVIDKYALDARVLANNVQGPFRAVTKAEREAAGKSNGNGNGQAASAPARSSSPAPARQQGNARPAPTPAAVAAPKAGPAPADDDIPF